MLYYTQFLFWEKPCIKWKSHKERKSRRRDSLPLRGEQRHTALIMAHRDVLPPTADKHPYPSAFKCCRKYISSPSSGEIPPVLNQFIQDSEKHVQSWKLLGQDREVSMELTLTFNFQLKICSCAFCVKRKKNTGGYITTKKKAMSKTPAESPSAQ